MQKPFLELFPTWFLTMSDTNKEVAKLATNAFESMFTVDKRPVAFFNCIQKYFKCVYAALNQTQETLMEENSSLNEFNALEVCDRICVSAF